MTLHIGCLLTQYIEHASISHCCSTAFWSNGNAAVERLSHTLKSCLQEHPTGVSLQTHASNHLTYYRATPHGSTGCSPSKLLQGHNMHLWLLVITSSKADTDTYDVNKQQQRNRKHYNQRNAVWWQKLRADYVHVRKPGLLVVLLLRSTSCPEAPASYQLGDESVKNMVHLAPATVNNQTRDNGPAVTKTWQVSGNSTRISTHQRFVNRGGDTVFTSPAEPSTATINESMVAS